MSRQGTMRFFMLCKRHYTNKDLIADRFGRLYHLPVELGKLGHEGLVIAADYRTGPRDGLTVQGVEFRTEGLSVCRVPFFPIHVLRQARQFRPDVVLASGDIHLGAAGQWIARRLGVPFVFDVYDNYEAFASARIPGFKKLFRRTLRDADLVVCVSEPLQRLAQRLNESTVIIPNGVDPDLFKPMDQKLARSKLGIPETGTVVGYFGAIAENRGVDVLIEAVRLLRSDGREVRLLLAGVMGVDLDLSEDWIDYRGVVPQDQVPVLINGCDVLAIPYLSDAQVDFSSAAKLPEYLACGVPVVVTRVSDYASFFPRAPEAVCVPGDTADMARAIDKQFTAKSVVASAASMRWNSLVERLAEAIEQTRSTSLGPGAGQAERGERGSIG